MKLSRPSAATRSPRPRSAPADSRSGGGGSETGATRLPVFDGRPPSDSSVSFSFGKDLAATPLGAQLDLGRPLDHVGVFRLPGIGGTGLGLDRAAACSGLGSAATAAAARTVTSPVLTFSLTSSLPLVETVLARLIVSVDVSAASASSATDFAAAGGGSVGGLVPPVGGFVFCDTGRRPRCIHSLASTVMSARWLSVRCR